MGTITRLNQAKKKLSEAESQMPGAYQNNYADNIRQKLGQLAQASDSFGTGGADSDALNEAYQQYRAKAVGNAQNGAAAAADTASALGGGYGTDWAQTAANQAAGEQIAGVDNSLSGLRADALQNWKQKLSDTGSVLDDLLGQQSLDRAEYDGSVSNAQDWRDYLSSRVDTARQENANFWNNVWTGVKGVGSAALGAYDAYMGYSTQKMNAISQAEEMYRNGNVDGAKAVLKMYRMDENMFDNLQGVSNVSKQQIEAAKDIYSLVQSGAPDEMIAYYCNQYGLDPEIYKNWSGLSDADKTNLDYLMKAGEYKGSGYEGLGNTILSKLGYSSDAVDDYSTVAGRINASNLKYQEDLQTMQNRLDLIRQEALQKMQQKYSTASGTSSRRSSGSSSGSTSGNVSTQSAAGMGSTGNKLPLAVNKSPAWTNGTRNVLGTVNTTNSLAGDNLTSGLNVAKTMTDNGKSPDEIMDHLIRAGYTDNDISRISNVMGW